MKTRIYEDLSHLYRLWRDACLGESGSEKREAQFLIDLFKAHGDIKSAIDLGSGVGVHTRILADNGYDMTLFDQSEKALSIVQAERPRLKSIRGSFEDINISETYDASICMWSTLSYVWGEQAHQHFYSWIADHTKSLIVLDEPNFTLYSPTFHKVYEGENETHRIVITRDWVMENNVKRTKFLYEITEKATGEMQTFEDQETQEYLTLEQIQDFLGPKWKLEKMYGDYDINALFKTESSSRMIFIFIPV